MKEQIVAGYQVLSDGRTCWVNAPTGESVARFSAVGIDVHRRIDLPDIHRKDIENRQRTVLSTTGPLLIHVSARATSERHAAALTVARKAGVPEELLPTEQGRLLGGIVGCVFISQVLPKSSLFDQQYRWKFDNHIGYVLSKRTKIPFRPVSGGQGVFHVDLTRDEEDIIRGAGIL